MNTNKNLIRNILIYMVGNFGSKVLVFLLLPLYTKYLTTSEYGLYDIITITSLLLLPLITFQLEDGVYRLLQDNINKNRKKNIISTSLITIVFNLLILLSIIFIINKLFIKQNILLIVLFFITNIFYKFWLQLSRALKRNFVYSISGVITTLIMIISNIIFIVNFKLGVNGLIISNILSLFIGIVYIEFNVNIRKYISLKYYDKKTLKELKEYSIPLIPNQINWWIMSVSDRYILNFYMGTSAIGIYSVANKFPSILENLNSIFNLAWQQTAIEEFGNKNYEKYVNKIFNKFTQYTILILILILPITRGLLLVLVSDKFSEAYLYIPILYLSIFFKCLSSFIGVFYQANKDTKVIFSTSIYGAVVNIMMNFILIPIIGMHGATISTLVSFYLMFKFRVKNISKSLVLSLNKQNKIMLFILFIICCIYYFNYYINLITLIIIIIIGIFVNKKRYIEFLRRIKNHEGIIN